LALTQQRENHAHEFAGSQDQGTLMVMMPGFGKFLAVELGIFRFPHPDGISRFNKVVP